MFLGIITDNTLSWNIHTDVIAPKLSQACYIFRRTKPFLSWDAHKMIYYDFSHQIMSQGLIFWVNSTHSDYIFKLQKRIKMEARITDS
jgi:hypothetical protein